MEISEIKEGIDQINATIQSLMEEHKEEIREDGITTVRTTDGKVEVVVISSTEKSENISDAPLIFTEPQKVNEFINTRLTTLALLNVLSAYYFLFT